MILSGSLILMFIFACSSSPENQSTTTTTSRDDDDEDDDEESKKDLACTLPKCSGSQCCNKIKDEDKKEECEKWCGHRDYLNLSSDAEDKCLALEYDFVEKDLVRLFGEDTLTDPNEEKLLKGIKNDDISTICAAVKELDPDIWGINSYVQNEAEVVLGWVAGAKQAIKIFEKTKEKKEGFEMFKKLLMTLSQGSGDQGVVEGLKVEISFDDEDESSKFLAYALDKNNDNLIQFIHNKILQDKKEGLCGDQKSSNWPTPETGAVASTAGYGPAGGSAYKNAEKHRQRACIMGVYCKTFPEMAEDKIREDLAQKVGDSGMERFIKSPVADGGLGLTLQHSEDWPQEVCVRLISIWDHSPNFNLGLTGETG